LFSLGKTSSQTQHLCRRLATPIKHRSVFAPSAFLSCSIVSQGDSGDMPTRPDSGLLVEEAEPKVKRPPLWQVILLNDDYTPMEFVVDVLERFFRMDRNTATRVMLEVHTRGKGVCGVFTYEIAETKVAQVTTYSRDNQHPLMCTLEEA
jgi:ATP-dependent Clp protease adaptor protein ClpS